MRIDVLPDDVLHRIFDFYVYRRTPWHGHKGEIEACQWQSLVHVCRRWRSLVFQSPRRLDLQLVCTHQTPAKDRLDIWPGLPLIVSFRGNIHTTLSGMDNVIAALGRTDRVRQVNLSGNWQQLGKVLAVMDVSFPELTILRLTLVGSPQNIPDTFLGRSAPRLQVMSLDSFPFPEMPKLLLSATHLIELRLHRISYAEYISPDAIVASLSMLTSLKSLKIDLVSSYPRPSQTLPTRKRSILPALVKFHFEGDTQYLEDLVSRIDTPHLVEMHMTFFGLNEVDLNCPRLAQFVNCTPTLRERDEAHLRFRNRIATVALRYRRSKSPFGDLQINIPCIGPGRQLLSIDSEVCNFLLHPLSTVEDLYIDGCCRLLWENNAIETDLWLELLRPFTAVQNLHLSEQFALGIAAALGELVGRRIIEVLPSLQNILLRGFSQSGPFQERIGQFLAARRLSNRPITISVMDRNGYCT